MKLLIEKIADLQALYVKELRLMLSAEEMIAIKSPLMADSAGDPELTHLFREHEQETEVHASRLREILHRIAGEASPLKCKVVYALFNEVEDLIEDASHVPVCDATLVTEAQRIEHYEIAAYGALVQLARALGLGEDAELLDQSLLEEERATQYLAVIAKRIYPTALMATPASEQPPLHAQNDSKRVSR